MAKQKPLYIPTAQEIMDKLREQRYQREQIEIEEALESATPRDTTFANNKIGVWLRRYTRKNSRKPMRIRLLITSHFAKNHFVYRHYLQLFVANKMEEEYVLDPSAFDLIKAAHPPYDEEKHGSNEYSYLYSFKPKTK